MKTVPAEPAETITTAAAVTEPVFSGEASKQISSELGLPDRYENLGRIAGGACGEVWRVRDTLLDRVIAMKVLRWEFVFSPPMRARFLAEAQLTAQLQHPGIVAVHDRGEFSDGRLWFTMKEVRGRTLDKVIDEVRAASGPEGFRDSPSGWTFRRLVDAFARICQAVGYAHRAGVVHRDLKPENLMVGEFGEALVMDWGLARRMTGARDAEGPSPARVPDGPRGAQVTGHGDVLGTPAYMPPEQARAQHELHGPESDVYALGAILYHLLTGRPPYKGSANSIWRQVLAGPPAPIVEIAREGPPLPAELAVICERAMRREIAERYPDAEHLAREVLIWLDGARRREQALAILEQARAAQPEIASLRAQAARAHADARSQLGSLLPYDPIDRKRPGWELEDQAARLHRDATLRETDWLRTVHGALSLDPDLPEAHAVLADHYRERLNDAEHAHRDDDAARFEVLLREHDRGRHAAFLRGEGALTLVTDPPGAEVTLYRNVLRDRRLVPERDRELGPTPLTAITLPRGSYVLRLRARGRAEVRYPVLIDRDGAWDGCPPGEGAPQLIALPRADELGPDDIYVPCGPCWTGGDPSATDGFPRRAIWIDAFIIRKFPVTHREYLDFLNDLVGAGREDEALAACPRMHSSTATFPGALAYGRDDAGRFALSEDTPGRLDWPVVLVDWYGASAFASWLAARTGQPWRLPDELEREKAARGVDGRLYPWGDHFDATWACVCESYATEAVSAGVDSYPTDESPYGVRGLAGNTRDWCMNVWTREGPELRGGRLVLSRPPHEDPGARVVRGGAWTSVPEMSRSAVRLAARPGLQWKSTGFRLARSYPG